MVDRPCEMSPRDTPRSCGIMPVQRCELDHRAPFRVAGEPRDVLVMPSTASIEPRPRDGAAG